MSSFSDQTTVIYDLGAHNGSDLPYYLAKADKVVAVEANPKLVEQIHRSFSVEIESGRLIVENAAVTDDPTADSLKFWLNTKSDALSSLVAPAAYLENYSIISVPAISVGELLSRHGVPSFVKIDLEGFDIPILMEFFRLGVFPESVSIEGHSTDALGVLHSVGNYRAFKLQHGKEIGKKFSDFQFDSRHGERVTYSFPEHSAGPYGDDLPQPWVGVEAAYDTISLIGPGWWDLHARNEIERLDETPPSFRLNWVIRRAIHIYLRSRRSPLARLYELGLDFLRAIRHR